MSDPLKPLLDLDGVAAAAKAAQDAVFAVHRLPANLRGGAETAAEASVRAARASAGIDGANPELPAGGAVADPLLAGALRVAETLEAMLPTWRRAPLQALARLHVLAAADVVTDQNALGRPRSGGERLELLAQLVTGATSVPGAVLTAVVHGELLALRPFGSADGVVARAAARLSMVATGLDPKSLTVPEVAFFRRVPKYVELVDGFAAGTPEGVREWLLFCCEAFEAGAREARSISSAAG
ncbi:oxidoreductase [Amycolatopsis sp. FDAARGOS 1241]|uniref:oxidoreductase n=1 Tax=Amycolatopsis sp. FDAARGOS 1241 TaxID=2778070 RepID=UPI00195221CC|nr:oxidoreductase [Amycolatopsis sp. FDAARGOS 1241]QRP46555.1 oxidoreductase [Amycolatopsis sp. FDAARGOS 1241]